MTNNQLLCMFTDLRSYQANVTEISSVCSVVFNKVYAIQNIEKPSEIFLTFNVDGSVNKDIFAKTILVHRKKQTNTLYTINALNQIVKEKNGGEVNFNYQIDWSEFSNSLVLTNDSGLRIIPTKIFKILSV